MLFRKFLALCFIFIIFYPSDVHAQKWKKSLKDISKKAIKEVKNQVKPLEIDFKVTKVNYNPLKSINKVTLTLDFNCNNPNNFGMTFNKTEFNLHVNDQPVSKFYNEKKITIPKSDKFTFQEKAEINLKNSGKTIFQAITKKNAVYTITGKYFINTSLGDFSFDIKLLEKEIKKEKVKKEKR